MNDITFWIKTLTVLYVFSLTVAHPATEESPREGKDGVAPIMQTLLSDIARELISRSTSNNQVKPGCGAGGVLTLNFTNLLILLVLKGLLWGASYAGTTAGHPKARSEHQSPEPLITETEILLLLSYLMGDDENNFDCLHRIACEDPSKVREYINVGHMVTNAAKFIGLNSSDNNKYDKMLAQLQDVVKFKENGGVCETRYTCNHDNENSQNTV